MGLTDEQRRILEAELKARVSQLPSRGFRRHWRQLAEIHCIRVALGISCEQLSKQLTDAGLRLSVISLTRVERGQDTHDGKPCPALQAELDIASKRQWVPDVGQDWMGLSDIVEMTGMTKSQLAEAHRSGRLAGMPERRHVDGLGLRVPRKEMVAWWSENGWWVAGAQKTPARAQLDIVASEAVAAAETPPRVKRPTRHQVRAVLPAVAEKPLITIDEAATVMDTTPRQIRNMWSKKQLPHGVMVKVEGLGLRVSVPHLRAWLGRVAT